MMRILIIIFALGMFPHTLKAETIKLLSGEHADFSRLVLQFPNAVDWKFGRTEEGYEFRVLGDDSKFDVQDVFKKIPRDRILEISTQRSGFVLTVSTGVHADVFELREGRIVIDIKDGVPSSDAEFELRISPDEADLNVALKGAPSSPDGTSEDHRTETLPDPSEAVVDDPNRLSGAGRDHIGASSDREIIADVNKDHLELPILFGSEDTNDPRFGRRPPSSLVSLVEDHDIRALRVEDLEQQLAKQIGRAASQGLLEADVALTENIVVEAETFAPIAEEKKGKRAHESEPEDENKKIESSHVLIRSPIDWDQMRQDKVDESGDTCLDNSSMDINDWGDTLDHGLQIPLFRTGAIGEFDTPNQDGIRRLARYYIFLTFGTEAKSVLTEFGVTVEGHDILWALADIMDRGYAANSGRFEQQFRCDGDAAFWSVMASVHLNTWDEYNLDSILSTFSALPFHVRRHLGPSLFEKFLEINDLDSAKYIQNAISRVSGEHNEAFDLLDAELQLADGDVGEAVSKLEKIVGQNGPMAAEALVKLIDTKARNGETIGRQVAENAEVMALEFRGSSYGPALQKAAVVARINSDDADIALRRILYASADLEVDNQQRVLLLSMALEKLASSENDMTFSKVLVGNLDAITNATITNSARLTTSQRLVDLGFFDEALSMMVGYSETGDDQAKMILAKAFLGVGEMDAAIRYSAQLSGEEARHVESRAYFHMNEPRKALLAAESLVKNSEKDTFAIEAEDWNSLERSQAPEMVQLADAFLAKQKILDDTALEVPSLSSAQDFLTSSRKMRSAFEAVLD